MRVEVTRSLRSSLPGIGGGMGNLHSLQVRSSERRANRTNEVVLPDHQSSDAPFVSWPPIRRYRSIAAGFRYRSF
jgi:hypothetical protein